MQWSTPSLSQAARGLGKGRSVNGPTAIVNIGSIPAPGTNTCEGNVVHDNQQSHPVFPQMEKNNKKKRWRRWVTDPPSWHVQRVLRGRFHPPRGVCVVDTAGTGCASGGNLREPSVHRQPYRCSQGPEQQNDTQNKFSHNRSTSKA